MMYYYSSSSYCCVFSFFLEMPEADNKTETDIVEGGKQDEDGNWVITAGDMVKYKISYEVMFNFISSNIQSSAYTTLICLFILSTYSPSLNVFIPSSNKRANRSKLLL